MMDIKATLNQAIFAAKAGRKAEARLLLERVLDADERNEHAWLWLSGVVENDEERIICLENVLTIDPHNQAARKGLVALGADPVADLPAVPYTLTESRPASFVADAPQPSAPQSASGIEPPGGEAIFGQPSTPDRRVFIAITIALMLILICLVVSILAFVFLSPTG